MENLRYIEDLPYCLFISKSKSQNCRVNEPTQVSPPAHTCYCRWIFCTIPTTIKDIFKLSRETIESYLHTQREIETDYGAKIGELSPREKFKSIFRILNQESSKEGLYRIAIFKVILSQLLNFIFGEINSRSDDVFYFRASESLHNETDRLEHQQLFIVILSSAADIFENYWESEEKLNSADEADSQKLIRFINWQYSCTALTREYMSLVLLENLCLSVL